MEKHRRFPTFGVIVLISGIVWFLSDLGIFDFNVPWLPLIIIIIAIGVIFNGLAR